MRSLLSVAVVSALALALAVWSPSAMAGTATTRPFVSSFDGSETPQGSFGQFIIGVAVDESSGHVYVASENLGSGAFVGVFDSAGKFIFQLEEPSIPEGEVGSIYSVAVDNSSGPGHGNVYVARRRYAPGGTYGAFAPIVTVFDSAGKYLYQLDGSDTPQGGFMDGQTSVALDANGNLFILTDNAFLDFGIPPYIFQYATSASSASYVSTITRPPNKYVGLVRDEAGDFYTSRGTQVEKLDPTGGLLSLLDTNQNEPALAIDPVSKDLLADDHEDVFEFSQSGTLVRRFAGTFPGTSAITTDGATGNTYVADPALHRIDVYGPPASVTVPDLTIEQPSPSFFSATLTGTVNPQGVATSYRFEYKLHSATSWSHTETQDAGGGTVAVPIEVQLPGLIQDTTYDVRLLGIARETGAIVSSAAKTFTTPTVPPPTIDPVASVTDHSALFSGSVNPQGVSASWRFEYSSDEVNWTKLPVPDENAGSGTSDVPVSIEAAGLDPNTTYHVRLVVTYLGGTGGSATSGEVGFTTNPILPVVAARSAFPVTDTTAVLRGTVDPEHSATSYWFEYGPADCASNPCVSVPATKDADAGAALGPRALATKLEGLTAETTYHFRLVAVNQAGTSTGADTVFTTSNAAATEWPTRGIELVSSPEKANQPVIFFETGSVGFSDSFGDEHAIWTTLSGTSTSPTGIFDQQLAKRTSSGWVSENLLSVSAYEGLVEALAAPDKLASAKGRMTVHPIGLDMGSGTRLFQLTDPEATGVDGYSIAYARVDGLGNFHVIFAMLPGENENKGINVIRGEAATEDLQRLFLSSYRGFDPGQTAGTSEIYEVSDGTPRIVSRLPDGTIAACGATFATSLGLAGKEDGAISRASEQDELVFFTSQGNNCSGPYNLYVTDVEAKTTQLISGPVLAGDPEPAGGNSQSGAYVGASLIKISRDGRSAVFTTRASLVATDDTDGNNEDSDVYLWTQGQSLRCLTCAAPNAQVESAIASEDLSHVYFTSRRQLVAGKGAEGPKSPDNLYVYHDGQIDYISPYTFAIGSKALDGDANTDVVPDGHAIFFVSVAPGTTPEDPGACELGRCAQVYRYDADNKSVECVTCRPVDAPPGPSFEFANDFNAIFGGASDDGRTFAFVSSYPLLPQDVNGRSDIYEWRDGRLRLVTDGLTQWPVGPGQPLLTGVTGDGANIFFTLGARLTGYEVDQTAQLYDARVGGGFPPPPTPPSPCNEDACQGPLLAPPALPVPGSASFSGPSNPTPAVAHQQPTRAKPHHAKRKRAKSHRRKRRGVRARHSRAINRHRGGVK